MQKFFKRSISECALAYVKRNFDCPKPSPLKFIVLFFITMYQWQLSYEFSLMPSGPPGTHIDGNRHKKHFVWST